MMLSKREKIVLGLLFLTILIIVVRRFGASPSEEATEVEMTSVTEQVTEVTVTREATSEATTESITEESSSRHLNHYNKEFWEKMNRDNHYNEQRRQAHEVVSLWYSINHSAPDLSWFQLTSASDGLAQFLYEDAIRLYQEGVWRTQKTIVSNILYEDPLTVKVVIRGIINSENNQQDVLTVHIGFNDDMTEIVSFEQVKNDEKDEKDY